MGARSKKRQAKAAQKRTDAQQLAPHMQAWQAATAEDRSRDISFFEALYGAAFDDNNSGHVAYMCTIHESREYGASKRQELEESRQKQQAIAMMATSDSSDMQASCNAVKGVPPTSAESPQLKTSSRQRDEKYAKALATAEREMRAEYPEAVDCTTRWVLRLYDSELRTKADRIYKKMMQRMRAKTKKKGA